MNKSLDILTEFWNHSSFREKQLEIIEAVMEGKDTLALLPTGGGKSICYQIPGIQMEGICLVVSPLIALMQDQVDGLNAKGIKAVAINSGLTARQIDIQLDNAIYGSTKFLYVSPERLKNRLFLSRFEKMNINLIAVDEAHCISQWGYDFRPAYLDISELRTIKKNVPILCLTATATAEVVQDIQEKLKFKEEHVIQKSFQRDNLIYSTEVTENKKNRIEEFISKTEGSGIIYCSTRKAVKELSKYLMDKNNSIDYYHAGLDFETRKKKQRSWQNGDTRIMVSTNAFGMGIDKSDVRFVIHADIPETIEAYFQEAGRAGRDEQSAQAILYYEKHDIEELKSKIELKYPSIDLIKRIYNALGNHFQLAIGAGEMESYPINLYEFSNKYELGLLSVYNALKFLELGSFIKLSEGLRLPSQLKVLVNNTALYDEQVKDREVNAVLQFILRTQMGVFDDYVKLNEFKLSQNTKISEKRIKEVLLSLSERKIVDFIPKSDSPKITYLTNRLSERDLFISPKFYKDRKDIAHSKLNAIIDFVESKECRNVLLLNYFNEDKVEKCLKCSACIKHSPEKRSKSLLSLLKTYVSLELKEKEQIEILDIITLFQDFTKDEILESIRTLVEENSIQSDKQGKMIYRN